MRDGWDSSQTSFCSYFELLGSRRAVVRQSSGSRQAVVGRSSNSRRKVVGQSSGSHLAVVGQLSGSQLHPTREWADYTHNIGMSQATIKPYLRACRATFILCNKKALAYYYRSSAWLEGRSSPERVVTIHKSPAQLYFLFGIFIIPRRCKYANEAGGPPEAKGVT